MVFAVERPGIDAATAEVGGEFFGVAVEGEDEVGGYGIDAPVEAVIVGVVGEGDDLVDPVRYLAPGLMAQPLIMAVRRFLMLWISAERTRLGGKMRAWPTVGRPGANF